MTRLFEWQARPFIVAEVGSNWANLDHCLESIKVAKECGADAVKFQLFSPNDLYGPGLVQWNCIKWLSDTECWIDYQTPYLNPFWLPLLKAMADECEIEFMCTAFSPEMVAAVDPYVLVHKVASSDLCYLQLLEAVAKTGKPVLLSTGASTEAEIRQAIAYFPKRDDDDRLYGSNGVILLYCVASYPAKSIDLRVIDILDTLASKTSCFGVGLSDHSTDYVGHPVSAGSNPGVLVLEKHFTAYPELATPDRPHSLTPSEFKTMVQHIRGDIQPKIGPTDEERDMLLKHNRRLIATREIALGDVLEYGNNYGAYRSLVEDKRGLSPFHWQTVEGTTARLAIPRGTSIGEGDFHTKEE